MIGYELALVNNVYVIFKPGQPHRFPASFAFEIGLRTLTKTGPYMEERRVFVSRSENYPDTMRMTTSAVFVVTSDPSQACTKKAISRDFPH